MISSIFGLALLFAPFLAIGIFADKPFGMLRAGGFVFVLFFVILFHTILAILTQFFGIFYYNVIISVVFFADAILIFILFKKQNILTGLPRRLLAPRNDGEGSLQTTNYKLLAKIDWALIFVIIIGFLTLYQIHYNYTGKISLATDQTVSYHEVKNMKYVYPYFSDEWYAVALTGKSIENHNLPLTNPFNNGSFGNLELFFHSFLTEIILILTLNPLTQYTLLSLFFNLLILVLIYLFLRQNNVPKIISAISALSCLYITYGANMPGLWNLIPFTLGIIFVLIMSCFISLNSFKMVFASFILGSLFYPPLFIFYFLGLISAVFIKYNNQNKLLLKISGCALAVLFVLVPTVSLVLAISPWSGFVNFVFSKLFFLSFSAPYFPQYAIYNMVLWPIILLVVMGMGFVFKNLPAQAGKKWLFFQLLLGIFIWFAYSFTTYRFMIEYERVVVLTSIIITIIAGFVLDLLAKKIAHFKYLIYAEIFVLLLFLVFIPFYTQRESWQKLVLTEPKSGAAGHPKAPANNYLIQDDLRIFENIKTAKFLSIPWKGTVIGTATGNYPVVTKEGTISMGSEKDVAIFLNSDCKEKEKIAIDFSAKYVYLPKFDCPSFKEIGKSQENLYLYEFKTIDWQN